MDLAVAGGGVIGLACAVEYLRRHPGRRVAIIDEPTRAGVASRAAAGLLAPFTEFDDDGPLAMLCRESFAMYPEFVLGLPGEVDFSQAGALVLSARHELESRAGRLSALRIRFELLDGSALRRAEPGLSTAFETALRVDEGVVNPRQLHSALSLAARSAGAEFIASPMLGVARAADGGIASLDLGSESITAAQVLLATGAWSASIGAMLGINIETVPVKGQMVLVGAEPGALRHVLHPPGVYLSPRPGEGIVVGATVEAAGFDASLSEGVAEGFRRTAVACLPGLAGAPVKDSWMGFRPCMPDKSPVIGRVQGVPNLLVATGHFRNGILLTPRTAVMVARMLDSEHDPAAAAFSPARMGL